MVSRGSPSSTTSSVYQGKTFMKSRLVLLKDLAILACGDKYGHLTKKPHRESRRSLLPSGGRCLIWSS